MRMFGVCAAAECRWCRREFVWLIQSGSPAAMRKRCGPWTGTDAVLLVTQRKSECHASRPRVRFGPNGAHGISEWSSKVTVARCRTAPPKGQQPAASQLRLRSVFLPVGRRRDRLDQALHPCIDCNILLCSHGAIQPQQFSRSIYGLARACAPSHDPVAFSIPFSPMVSRTLYLCVPNL